MPWKDLTTLAQLDAIEKASARKPQLIYKHSTRCHNCKEIQELLNDNLAGLQKQATLHYLDLLSFREISNEIASRYGIVHQSPQVVVMHKGKPVFHLDHWDIHPDKISGNLEKVLPAKK